MAFYPFRLKLPASGRGEHRAEFSFIIDGVPVRGPRCVLSSRAAGDMRYVPGFSNPSRAAFFASLGLDSSRVRSCVQVHSRKVLLAEGPAESPAENLNEGAEWPRADGLVSAGDSASGSSPESLARGSPSCRSPSGELPVLAVTVADCLPVFLWDTSSGALGLVHSGWKGTGIVLEALDLMEQYWGTAPEQVAALLGPCIQRRSYQVDAERARQFEGLAAAFLPLPEHARFEDSPVREPELFPGPLVLDDRDGVHCYLGLQAANARLLESRGVRHIGYCEDCTFSDSRLGSFRREGKDYTRMAALLGWF